MGKLTPEQQAAVDVLAMKSRLLYESILKAKPPEALGLAIRDGRGFESLNDESVAAVAVGVMAYEKALAGAITELEKQPTPPAENGTKPANGEPTVVPAAETEVLPATTSAPSKAAHKRA